MPLGGDKVDPHRLHLKVLLVHRGVWATQVEVSLQVVRTDLLCQLLEQIKLRMWILRLESEGMWGMQR